MPKQFKVISSVGENEQHTCPDLLPEEKLRHFRNVNSSILRSALDTWDDIWNALQGSIVHGVLVLPEAEDGIQPNCGWPEFLEKMWLLRHYLDYAKRFCEGGK